MVTNVLCEACTYGFKSAVYRAAEKYKVPAILWGDSPNEITLNMQAPANTDTSKMKRIQRRLLSINSWKAEYYQLLQKLEFPVPGNNIFSRKLPALKNKDIKEIYVFYYLPWDRRKIKETIARELGWQKLPDQVSSWRIDCLLHPLVNYCFYNIYGCSKDCFGYCNMINSGQMNRKEALEQEEDITAFTKNIRTVLKDDVGLSDKEADKIESWPKKTQARDS
jgi:hypothetical protein